MGRSELKNGRTEIFISFELALSITLVKQIENFQLNLNSRNLLGATFGKQVLWIVNILQLEQTILYFEAKSILHIWQFIIEELLDVDYKIWRDERLTNNNYCWSKRRTISVFSRVCKISVEFVQLNHIKIQIEGISSKILQVSNISTIVISQYQKISHY